jgi:hypothetical protein
MRLHCSAAPRRAAPCVSELVQRPIGRHCIGLRFDPKHSFAVVRWTRSERKSSEHGTSLRSSRSTHCTASRCCSVQWLCALRSGRQTKQRLRSIGYTTHGWLTHRSIGLPQWQMSAGVGQCGRTHRYEPSLHQIFTEHISKSHGNQRQTMDVKEFFGAMTGAGWLDKK